MMDARRWRWWCVLLFAAMLCAAPAAFGGSDPKRVDDSPISRIAFGSCANQSAPQPIWEAINKFNPQLFIWMGDNIYGDNKRPFKIFGKERTIGPWKNVPRFVPSSEEEMMSKYALAKSTPGYSRLRQNAKVIGTWDDHDYGLNDAGKEFEHKITNQKLMLDFLDEPPNSPRRKQAGVYASYTFGPNGKKIKVILLDTRYHRDPLKSDGNVLGDAQWTWLEKEMRGPSTALTIIVSSVQAISNLSATTGPLFYMESWGRFPKERARLFQLISDSKRNGVLFISGDVHFGEITRYDCAVGYPLYDVTSSGLTQSVEKVVPHALRFVVKFLAWFTPSTMRVMNQNCKEKSCTYAEQNFGTIEIDWTADPVNVKLQVRDVNGDRVLDANVSLSELQSHDSKYPIAPKKGKFQRHCTLEVDLPSTIRYRLASFIYVSVPVLLVCIIGFIWGAVLVIRASVWKCKTD